MAAYNAGLDKVCCGVGPHRISSVIDRLAAVKKRDESRLFRYVAFLSGTQEGPSSILKFEGLRPSNSQMCDIKKIFFVIIEIVTRPEIKGQSSMLLLETMSVANLVFRM